MVCIALQRHRTLETVTLSLQVENGMSSIHQWKVFGAEKSSKPSLLDVCPEVRVLIYQHVFCQSSGELLGLSREPEHDYDQGPPDDWTADSRQEGLVFNFDAPRLEPTNSRFLRTCRIISEEASSVFYGQSKIVLYAEDNNDIFYWLLDIGERNRHAICYLEISWAYGVSLQSGRENIHGILERINDMDDAPEEEIRDHREQLIRIVRRMESKTVSLSKNTPHWCPHSQVT